MLDNEPVGGERTGNEPAAETADSSPTPTRRARTTRRRATPAADPASGANGVESGTAVPGQGGADPAGSAPEPGPGASTEAGTGESAPPPVKATRRRRKITVVDDAVPAGGEATAEPSVTTTRARSSAAAEESTADAEAPVRATRTRRRRTAATTEQAGTEQTAPEQAAPERAGTEQTARVQAAPEQAGTEQTGTASAGARRTRTASTGTASTGIDPLAGGVTAAPVPAAPGEKGTGDSAATAGEPAEQPEPTRTRRRRTLLSAPTVLFMPPDPSAATPLPSRAEPADEPAVAEDAEPTETGRRRRRGRRTQETAEAVAEPAAESAAEEIDEGDDTDDEFDASGSRRRRRGRRGRGRGKGSADEIDEAEEPAAAEADSEDGDDSDEPLTRRRRRRRRKGAGEEGVAAEDGVPTVVRIREPRRPSDEVQGVTGSTRLEAKRQRRRDGRDQRRTRPPILSESEFLARREAVDRVMVVRQRGERTQIAVLEDGVLVEHYVTRASTGTMAGNVYLGKVQNVLPSMEAAFVDVGRGRNAVLYAGEVNWDTTGLEGRARSIEQALKSGDSVLVQVTKDPIGHKGARLTSHIALSGRHLVYVPNGNASGISRKLPDNERKRLRDILKKMVPDGAGVIVRTAAEGASEDDLARDVKRLQTQWEDIRAKTTSGGAPVLLYEEPDLVIRVVRDLFNEDFRELVVQGEEAYAEVEAYLSHVSPDLVARLRRHTGVVDVFAERRIDEQILKGLDRKVFLPSGGHLVIDRTEAMTVVDVNTGKYTGAGGNLEETVTRNNLEAAEEIVRQLRLRDLGGIVVIDFIDMVLESNRDLVLRRLTECLGRDRTKHQVTEITSLGLVQMTRKRIGAGLLEAFSETCEACKGRGLIMHTEPVGDKARQGAGAADKVKAVASAASGSAGLTGTKAERRRSRKAAAVEPAPVEEAVVLAADDETMGYDLSRYADDVIPIDEDVDVDLADADLTGSTHAGSARATGARRGAGNGVVESGTGGADGDGEPDDGDAITDARSGPAGSGESGEGGLADVDDGADLDEDDDEPAGLVSSGRRRARRSGTRRRTRP